MLKRFLPERVRTSGRRLKDFLRSVQAEQREAKLLRQLRQQQTRAIAAHFAKEQVIKVQLGSGSNLMPGWLNTEGFDPTSFTHALDVSTACVYLNVCETFPFADHSIDYIFHEHVMEHLTYPDAQSMLRECYRVLQPGGKIRIAMPDFAYFLRLYFEDGSGEKSAFLDEYIRFNSSVWSTDLAHVRHNKAVFVINHALRAWGHRFLYDEKTLSAAMAEAGFVKCTRQEPRKSADPHFCDLELRKDMVGILDALIVEAEKPLHFLRK